jgi:hypothetical protein
MGALAVRKDGQETQATGDHGRHPREKQSNDLKIAKRIDPGSSRRSRDNGNEHTHDAGEASDPKQKIIHERLLQCW